MTPQRGFAVKKSTFEANRLRQPVTFCRGLDRSGKGVARCGGRCYLLSGGVDEKGTFEVPLRVMSGGIGGFARFRRHHAGNENAFPDCFRSHIHNGSGIRHPQGKRRMTMIGVWLYALGIAVAGFIVWKFIPEDKRP